MCGIAGFIDHRHELSDPVQILRDFVQGLSHRGPDDRGFYHDESVGVGLTHSRLSIIDTSPAGHQPMTSRNRRWTIVFNGEIYNAGELKTRLDDSQQLRGHSDTEILCETIARLGVCDAARSAIGMFSFAAWDSQERKLHLVRDRLGIKPLYLARNGKMIAFASESRVLSAVKGLCGGVDSDSLQSLLRFGYMPGIRSIHRNVQKIKPGTCVTIHVDGELVEETTTWWSADATASQKIIGGTDDELLSEIGSCLDASVSSRLISDRPLGAFLSGGIDSSLVVSAMTRLSSKKVQTFSIGFSDESYDESGHARAVANHLGTDHTEHRVNERDILDIVPGLGSLFDEPFADSSQIPMLLLCRMTRQDVVVSLSGDGGDELFGGYDRYEWTIRLWNMIRRIPRSIRLSSSFSIEALPMWFSARLISLANIILPGRLRIRNPLVKAMLISRILRSTSVSDLYFRVRGHWHPIQEAVSGSDQELSKFELPDPGGHDDRHRMMLWDQCNYLPDDILVKVDRTSMSVGLEARVPLLDHRMVELAWRLPSRMKVRDNETKWAFRRLLEREVPRNLWDRPKMGFGVPLGSWLRGPLRDWAESLLDVSRLENEGHLNAQFIRRTWDDHVSGKTDQSYPLWDVLMFQSWLESQ